MAVWLDEAVSAAEKRQPVQLEQRLAEAERELEQAHTKLVQAKGALEVIVNRGPSTCPSAFLTARDALAALAEAERGRARQQARADANLYAREEAVLPGYKRIPAWYLGPLTPDRFLALAEVVKAYQHTAEELEAFFQGACDCWPEDGSICFWHRVEPDLEALARLEELD